MRNRKGACVYIDMVAKGRRIQNIQLLRDIFGFYIAGGAGRFLLPAVGIAKLR